MKNNETDECVRVSVIIPCYNDGAYIPDAVDSIKRQTFTDYEIVVINDGSTDKTTMDVLKQLEGNGVRVLHKKNEGVSTARNYGITRSAGEYILTLDADDKFSESFMERAVKILDDNTEIGCVTCYAQYFGINTRHIRKPEEPAIADILNESYIDGSLMYRRQCWIDAGGYDTELEGVEDWDFIICVIEKGWKIHVIPEPLFYYRVTQKSLYENTRYKKPKQMKRIVENHLELYQQHVADCIYEREKKIQDLELKLTEFSKAYQNSWNYKIGRTVLSPFRKIFRNFHNRK